MTIQIAPNAANLSLGKGELYLKRRTTAGLDTGYFSLGYAQKFETTPKPEVIEFYSPIDHNAALVAAAVKKTKIELTVEDFEFAPDNIALALAGDAADFTQTLATVTAEVLATAAQCVLGRYYTTAKRNISSVVVHQGATTGVLNTDYKIIDATEGIIQILTGGTFAAGASTTIDYTGAAITAGTYKQITLGTSSLIQGTLLFRPDPQQGPKMSVKLWNVMLTPNGAVGFISEDWNSFQLTGMVQNDGAGVYGGSATNPYGQVIEY